MAATPRLCLRRSHSRTTTPALGWGLCPSESPRTRAGGVAGLRIGVLNHFHSTDLPCVIGTLKRNPLNYYLTPRKVRARILHYHHARWSTLVALALGRRGGSCYVLTLHNPRIRRQLTSPFPLMKRVTRWALGRFDVIVAVRNSRNRIDRTATARRSSDRGHSRLRGTGLRCSTRVCRLARGFLTGRSYSCRFGLPNRVPAGRPRIYGLDTAVAAFRALAVEDPALRLAIFIARRPSRRKARRYLARLEARLEEAGLHEREVIAFGLPLLPVFRHDVFLPPSHAKRWRCCKHSRGATRWRAGRCERRG